MGAGTTRNRFSFTALSMIWRKLAGIERLRDCGYGRQASPAAPNTSAVYPPRPAPKRERNKSWSGCVIFVAVDIGGTFTDLIGFDDETQTFVQAKSLTTPAELTQGVINCLKESGIEAGRIDD
jgi:hypothetical protein